MPPLVFAGEIDQLRTRLAAAAEGRAFVLQGGDCAETFAGATADQIRARVKTILQMAVVLTYGASVPVVKMGRMAGQFAKPRSSETETRDGTTLPAYRGDIVNGYDFTAASRAPDPGRLVRGYHTAAATLNLVRAFTQGGFADLRQVHSWNRGFAANPANQRYEVFASEIDRAVRFMEAAGADFDELKRVEFYTAHEALLMEYERAMTRIDSRNGTPVDTSAHFVWVGERTRALGHAHLDFVSRIRNPIGVKLGPSVTPDELERIVDLLDPEREPGRLTLITRMGAGRIRDALPPLLEASKRFASTPLWITDPMHGNGITTPTGYKTRRFDDVVDEVQGFFAAHRAAGTWPGGIHIELTGDDVTECLGGSEHIDEADLASRVRVALRPAAEPHAVPRARVPRRRGADPPVGGARGRPQSAGPVETTSRTRVCRGSAARRGRAVPSAASTRTMRTGGAAGRDVLRARQPEPGGLEEPRRGGRRLAGDGGHRHGGGRSRRRARRRAGRPAAAWLAAGLPGPCAEPPSGAAREQPGDEHGDERPRAALLRARGGERRGGRVRRRARRRCARRGRGARGSTGAIRVVAAGSTVVRCCGPVPLRSLSDEVLRLEELVEHGAGVAGPLLRVAGGRPEREVVERGRHLGVLQARRRHGVVRVLVGDLHGLLAAERLLADEHLVHHDADRVDVAAGVRDAPGDELGGEVRDRAEQRLAAGGVARGGAGEPEVADLDPAVVREQHVLGLQVAVDDPRLVRGDESREHRLEDVHRLVGGEAPVLAEQVAERDALQVLHDEVGEAVVLALVEHVDHVRVGEARGAAGLLDEALAEVRVVREVRMHDLHRDAAVEAQVRGEVDRRHPAAGDAGAHLVATVEEAADHGIGRRRGHASSVWSITAWDRAPGAGVAPDRCLRRGRAGRPTRARSAPTSRTRRPSRAAARCRRPRRRP